MKLQRLVRSGVVVMGCVAVGYGATALYAVPPGPDCGPTRQWWCELPGCPDCYVTQFEGTICEKNAYEKKTGRVCHPE